MPSEKRVLITQSNYIPWKGYFDAIRGSDVCVLYDDVQYTKRDWRNRNKIKTAQGLQWLSIPVVVAGRFTQTIRETAIADRGWAKSHWASLTHAYARAPFFDQFKETFAAAYERAAALATISEVNLMFIEVVNSLLGCCTELRASNEFELTGDPTERLVNVCRQLNATEYRTGPAAKAYLREECFAEHGIRLAYLDYSGYPFYRQLHGEFEHGVTILDLLFNTGPDALQFMKEL